MAAVEGEEEGVGGWDRTHRRLSRCAMLVMDTLSHYCKSINLVTILNLNGTHDPI